MAPLPNEQCDSCMKHLPKLHQDNQKCVLCLPKGGTLQRCKACQMARYCTKECQRVHWKTHKPICHVNILNKQRADAAGEYVAERRTAFHKWVFKNIQSTMLAGVNALDLHHDRERTETNVFLVYLDAVEIPSTSTNPNAHQNLKISYHYSIRSASCVPLQTVHALYASRFAGGSATLNRDLSPNPRVLKMMIIDDGLPPPLDTFSNPVNIGEDIRAIPYFGPDWLRQFRMKVGS